MVKSAIKVVVRVRPTPNFAASAIDLHADKKVPHPPPRELPRPPASPPPLFSPLSIHSLSILPRCVQTVNVHLPKNAKFGDVVNSQPQDYNFKCAPVPLFLPPSPSLSLSRALALSVVLTPPWPLCPSTGLTA